MSGNFAKAVKEYRDISKGFGEIYAEIKQIFSRQIIFMSFLLQKFIKRIHHSSKFSKQTCH
ncbi:MAG: hypothetical protein AAF551_07750, partial [Bacteroidota bacterium]